MFPEYRDLITQLKTTDAHFARLFDKHNALDQKIRNMETHVEPGTHEEGIDPEQQGFHQAPLSPVTVAVCVPAPSTGAVESWETTAAGAAPGAAL